MEHSMRLVEAHCSKYLDMFVECIQTYPHTWQMDCEPERAKLARCAETNPEILHIKSTCSKQFQLYEQCMNDNQAQPEMCTALFSDFTSCADEALKSITPSGAATVNAVMDEGDTPKS